MLKRIVDNKYIQQNLLPGKALIIYGPRRVGKTTILQEFTENYSGKFLMTTGEDRDIREVLQSESINTIKSYLTEFSLLIIDEAQKIQNVGAGLKLVVDHLPHLKVIVTGSSSLDLAQKTGEPLTGRRRLITVYPISVEELSLENSKLETHAKLEELLRFGSYPETITYTSESEKIEYLANLVDSYLYKDILELEELRNAEKLISLLRLLAFQIGSEVSLNELANNLDISKQTVDRYLDLLQKAFVLVKVGGFSRNLRKEVSKTSRYYFYDLGVRNAIIRNHNPLKLRNDVGQLWENFLLIERIKKLSYSKTYSNRYFWRTYDQKEIDYVEEREGKLYGYEFKFAVNKDPKAPQDWLGTYKNASYQVINRQNYFDFIT